MIKGKSGEKSLVLNLVIIANTMQANIYQLSEFGMIV